MSDTEHDRIARLLREQGQAEAPPDLAGDVMAQVRREPQATPVHHGVNWRPVAAWAAVAAALLAVGVGIAQLAPGGSSSSSGSTGGGGSAVLEGAGGSKAAAPVHPSEDSMKQAYTVPRHEAEKILANGTTIQPAMSSAARSLVTLNRAQWNAVRGKLAAAAARHPHPHDPVIVRLRPN